MNVSTLSTPENELEDIILAYLTAADAGQADGLWAGMVRLRLGNARDWRRRADAIGRFTNLSTLIFPRWTSLGPLPRRQRLILTPVGRIERIFPETQYCRGIASGLSKPPWNRVRSVKAAT